MAVAEIAPDLLTPQPTAGHDSKSNVVLVEGRELPDELIDDVDERDHTSRAEVFVRIKITA